MEGDEFFGSAYKGSKQFRQQEVKTANATGFGAAADDYMERGIDLNEQLIKNKPATFFFRMRGDAMKDAGIFDNDILVVDRSLSKYFQSSTFLDSYVKWFGTPDAATVLFYRQNTLPN